MSEENGAIVVPMYYTNLGSRHSSYTSHASRLSYTSHGDLLGALGGKQPTKESRLRSRSSRASQASQATPVVSQQPQSLMQPAYREYVSHWRHVGVPFRRALHSNSPRKTEKLTVFLPQEPSADLGEEQRSKLQDNPFIDSGQVQNIVNMKGTLAPQA